jgi:transposase InsO family protein
MHVLANHGILPSMSRPGNPYDNAFCESFMKTLKREEISDPPRILRQFAQPLAELVLRIAPALIAVDPARDLTSPQARFSLNWYAWRCRNAYTIFSSLCPFPGIGPPSRFAQRTTSHRLLSTFRLSRFSGSGQEKITLAITLIIM